MIRRIWAIYGILIFLILVAIHLPFYIIILFIKKEKGESAIIWWSHKIVAKIYLFLIGIRLQTVSKVKIDPKESYIIVSNHRSHFDFLANALSFPGLFKFLSKAENIKLPLFGWVIKHLTITVNRSSRASRKNALEVMAHQLKKEQSILLYPEGTRNKTEVALSPFYDGAFNLSAQTGNPILIQTLVYDYKKMAPSGLQWFPGTIRAIWSGIVFPKNKTAEEIKNQVKSVMLAELNTEK